MRTAKSSQKSGTKRAKAAKKPKKLNVNDDLAALRLENEKLRATLSDTWELLNTVNVDSSSADMFAVIDTACHEIITNHPEEFHYEEVETKDDDTEGDVFLAATENMFRSVAEELKVPLKGLPKVDFYSWLTAWRKVVSLESNVTFEPEKFTDDGYVNFVRMQVGWAILETAKPPTTLKGEYKKYLETVKKLKAAVPQSRRKAHPDVERAIRMYKKGKRWSDIFCAIFPDLSSMRLRAQRDKKKKFRSNVTSLISIRERRAIKKPRAKKIRANKGSEPIFYGNIGRGAILPLYLRLHSFRMARAMRRAWLTQFHLKELRRWQANRARLSCARS